MQCHAAARDRFRPRSVLDVIPLSGASRDSTSWRVGVCLVFPPLFAHLSESPNVRNDGEKAVDSPMNDGSNDGSTLRNSWNIQSQAARQTGWIGVPLWFW